MKTLTKGKSYLLRKNTSINNEIMKVTIMDESKKCYHIKWPSGHFTWEIKEGFVGTYLHQYEIIEEF